MKFVIEELNNELNLLRNNHPCYTQDDFITTNDFNVWKTAKMQTLERKIRVMEMVKPISGQLKITVESCESLGDNTLVEEKMNIFCAVKVNSNVQNSTVKSGSRHPVIGETFEFDINSFETKIKIEVYNKKFIGSSFLGCVVLTLKDIMWEKMPYSKSVYLEPLPNSNNTVVTGSVKLQFNLSFRIGPSSLEVRSPELKKENALSHLFRSTKQEDNVSNRQRIEHVEVKDYYQYFRYLIFIILLESYEAESRRLALLAQQEETPTPTKPVGLFSTHKKPKPLARKDCDPVTPCKELQWLITNFKLRYNISDTFEYLVMLEALVNSFKLTCDHLTMIHYTLLELAASMMSDRFLWKREASIYDKLVACDLKTELEDVLSNYFLKFPDCEPEGALSIVIALYSLLCDHSKLGQLIHEKTESAMIKMYKAVVGDRPSESSLIDASKFVTEILELEDKYFNNVFPPENNHTNHCINIYYSEMLSKNIRSLLRASPPISENIMTLYQQLKKLNQKVLKLNPQVEVLPLSQIFQPFVSKWIEKIGDQLPSWCNKVLKRETWKALSLDENNPALHSLSVQELFDIINEIYNTYRDFEMRSSKDLKNLQKIIENTITTYINGVVDQLSAEMGSIHSVSNIGDSDRSTIIFNKNSDSPSLTKKNPSEPESTLGKISPKYMTWMMNFEAIAKKLYDFCTQMETDGEKGAESSKESFSDIFSFINQAEQQVIYHVICKFNQNPELEAAFESFLDNPPDASKLSTNDILQRMTPLFEYINASVKMLCENLDFKVCLRVVEKIWECVVEDLNVILYPAIPARKFQAKAVHLVERSYPFLIEFFHANGEGLPVPLLEKDFSPIKNALEMSKIPTDKLIKMHTDLKNGLKPQGSNFINQKHLEIHIIAILGSRKGDKEARKFAKANRDETMAKAVIKSFGLPSTEALLDWFSCFKDKYDVVSGYLYLTTNFVCFNTLLPTGHLVKIQLPTIQAIKKRKNSLCNFSIMLHNGVSVFFHTLNKNKAYDLIIEQADKIGIKLEVVDKQKDPSPSPEKTRRNRGYSLSEFDKRANSSSLVNTEESTAPGDRSSKLLKRVSSNKLKKEKRKSSHKQ